ncbi:MAG: diguanylate cyclase, partial [Rhizobiales bacterium]|nr:diguanylate cyclase [Hyphomicrobiales bacterium]
MSRYRNAISACAGLLRLVMWIALVFLVPLPAAQAASLADVGTSGPRIDLLPYLAALETSRRDVPIEKPGSIAGAKNFMILRAKGAGPTFRWVAGSFTNSGTTPRHMVIAIADQGFVGSGIYWPKPPSGHVDSITTAGPATLQRLSVAGKEAYGFTLEPGKTAAIAFEIGGPSLSAITLWQRDAFDDQKDYFAFFRGALLGIAALLALAMLALYGFRSRPVFLAASGFAVASVGFMMLEAGHLSVLLTAMHFPALTLTVARALIEGLMAVFLILYLITVLDLRRFLPVLENMPFLMGGLVLAVMVASFVEPAAASGIARVVFGLTALAGFGGIFFLWQHGDTKAEAALVSWSAILLWAFIGLVAILADPRSAALSPTLLSGLCAVLVVMVFALVHQAFSKGYLSQRFFREAGRRALALAGARAYVWDWQPEDSDLHVGEEIERALGLQPGLMAEAGVDTFLELMHPSDRAAYVAAIETAELQGNGVIERQFRLRHGDGDYRWFQLRGRGMPGSGDRAIRCIGTLTDVTEAKRTEERLLSDAVYDVVTGLPNRPLFIDRLARALTVADAAAQTNVHIVLADIDRFKTVNDALGHEMGDGLLTVIARRLSAEMGPNNSVARLPGGQFAILFLALESGRTIEAFAETVRGAIALPITLDTQEIFLTACIGVAHNREPGLSAERLLKDAAIALYEAKRRGSGTIEIFRTSMRDDRAELVVLEQELRRAIERNEIEVHYQPIAQLADMNLAGFEALVRWRHPTLGLLAPESFVGLAEQTGMIKDIGRAVLNEAGRQLGIWQRSFRQAEPVFVAVNISSAQLIDPSLIDDIAQVLHRETVTPGSLKIEVTESLVMQYPELAGHILERLKNLGVG